MDAFNLNEPYSSQPNRDGWSFNHWLLSFCSDAESFTTRIFPFSVHFIGLVLQAKHGENKAEKWKTIHLKISWNCLPYFKAKNNLFCFHGFVQGARFVCQKLSAERGTYASLEYWYQIRCFLGKASLFESTFAEREWPKGFMDYDLQIRRLRTFWNLRTSICGKMWEVAVKKRFVSCSKLTCVVKLLWLLLKCSLTRMSVIGIQVGLSSY